MCSQLTGEPEPVSPRLKPLPLLLATLLLDSTENTQECHTGLWQSLGHPLLFNPFMAFGMSVLAMLGQCWSASLLGAHQAFMSCACSTDFLLLNSGMNGDFLISGECNSGARALDDWQLPSLVNVKNKFHSQHKHEV